MNKAKLFLTALVFLAGSLFVNAQNLSVSGIVTEAGTDVPVVGASVVLQSDNSKYSMTDYDGRYAISSVPSNGTLVVTLLGYKDVVVAVNGRSNINIQMEVDSEFLEDAIVMGYGSAKKISAITGSAATVGAKLLKNAPVASLADALQGQVAGLQVWSDSGEPSATVTMRIRGANSINASTEPLYILDGSPVASSIFNALNANDIENVTIMKDASATAIYGSRAANGIVFITTKKGARTDHPVVSVRAQYGVSQMVNRQIELMNTEEWFDFNEMLDPTFLDQPGRAAQKDFALDYGVDTDWINYFFQKYAPTFQADASISGATEKTDYYISLGGLSQEGNAPFSSMSRVTLLNKINTQVKDWLKVGLSMNLTYQDQETTGFAGTQNSVYNPMYMAQQMLPWISPYEHSFDEDGNIVWGDEKEMFNDQQEGMYNTVYLQKIQPGGTNYIRLNGNIYQQITPFKGLTLKAVQAITANDRRSTSKANPVGPFEGAGSASEVFSRYYQFTLSNTAEYIFTLADEHNFELLVGQEVIVNKTNQFGADVEGITDLRQDWLSDGIQYNKPSWSMSDESFNSFFGRVAYNYNDRYMIDASFRRDGSSLFGKNRRYANFYSVGARWNLMNEEILEDVDWLNTLSLKASYGTTGNSGIDNYLSYGVVGAYTTNYNGNISWGLGNPANDDLTWEVVNNFNLGISTRVFNSLSIDVDYYNKLTTDMLMEIPFSHTTGHSGGWGNVSDMLNRGVDVELSWDVPMPRDFYFNIAANLNYNYNEITSLFDGNDELELGDIYKLKVGHALQEFYMVRSAGVDPRDGQLMWYDKDGNITKVYSEDNKAFTGLNALAPWAGGFNLNFAYKGLSVGAQFSYVLGKYTVNNDRYFIMNPNFASTSNQAKEMLNMWTTPGQITDVAAADCSRQFDTSYIENASFLRLKNLQVSYSLPQDVVRRSGFLGGVRIFVVGRNLLTLTEYTGYDPEYDGGIQLGRYPNSKQYTCGIELTF